MTVSRWYHDVYLQSSGQQPKPVFGLILIHILSFEMSLWLPLAAILLYGLVHLNARPSRETESNSERLRYDPSFHHVRPLISKYNL